MKKIFLLFIFFVTAHKCFAQNNYDNLISSVQTYCPEKILFLPYSEPIPPCANATLYLLNERQKINNPTSLDTLARGAFNNYDAILKMFLESTEERKARGFGNFYGASFRLARLGATTLFSKIFLPKEVSPYYIPISFMSDLICEALFFNISKNFFAIQMNALALFFPLLVLEKFQAFSPIIRNSATALSALTTTSTWIWWNLL